MDFHWRCITGFELRFFKFDQDVSVFFVALAVAKSLEWEFREYLPSYYEDQSHLENFLNNKKIKAIELYQEKEKIKEFDAISAILQ